MQFEIAVRPLDHLNSQGQDEVEFMLSTNPGMDLKPIGDAASGGELSRIMLAVKAVLAQHDEIPTLIFDEIDVGISGTDGCGEDGIYRYDTSGNLYFPSGTDRCNGRFALSD